MRAFGLTAVPLVVSLALAGCASAPAGSPPPVMPLTTPISISASCTPNGVSATVSPWVAAVRRGSDIEWIIEPGSAVEEVAIVQINDWPYNGAPPRVRKGNPGKGSSMKGSVQAGQRFHYGISFVCSDGRRVIIDPDIIVNAA